MEDEGVAGDRRLTQQSPAGPVQSRPYQGTRETSPALLLLFPPTMPVPIISQALREGLSSIPYSYSILKTLPWLLVLAALKYFFGGARNSSERMMHSKVVMVTVLLSPSIYQVST